MKKQVWVAIGVVAVVGVTAGVFFLRNEPGDRAAVGEPVLEPEPTETADTSEADPSEVLEDMNKTVAQVGDYEFIFHRSIVDLGGAHPEVSNNYEARHTTANKTIRATDLFSESALVAGFAETIQGDVYATDAETKTTFQRLKSSKTASDLGRHLAALEATTSLKSGESCDGEMFTFDPGTENFAIVDYEPSTSRVVLHIGVSGTSHVCDSGFPRLRIEVAAPPALKAALAEAQAGKKGFLPKVADLKACDTCDPVDFNKVELSGP